MISSWSDDECNCETDLDVAHRKILSDLQPAANSLNGLAEAFTEAVLKKYFHDIEGQICLQITNAPNDSDVFLLFYIEMPHIRALLRRQ
jgi:hypothetical protein